mgnify:CR=1 FL=1
MIIRVSAIPDEGIRIDGPEAFPRPFADPTWVLAGAELAVEKDADAVFVRGTLEARVPMVCGRCLEPFEIRRFPGGRHAVRFRAPRGGRKSAELAADDLETDVYAHDAAGSGRAGGDRDHPGAAHEAALPRRLPGAVLGVRRKPKRDGLCLPGARVRLHAGRR